MALLEFLKLALFAITRNNGAPSAIPVPQAPESGSTARCAVRSGGSHRLGR